MATGVTPKAKAPRTFAGRDLTQDEEDILASLLDLWRDASAHVRSRFLVMKDDAGKE